LSSLVSGYAAMGANIVYTLTSVPLALHYLSREEFGLWLLAAQLAGYLALIDLGMSGVSRILIDYKDTKEDGRYGTALKTTICVNIVQAVVIALAGGGLSIWVGPMLDIPVQFHSALSKLMFAHALLLAATFLTRVFVYALVAHQRYDVGNYAQIAAFGVNLGVLWLAFHNGAGLYSIIWAQASSWLILSAVSFAACRRWELLRVQAHLSCVTWAAFKEIFKFGQDIFLIQVGYQMVSATQTLIITRLLGLEAVALWSVCTRLYVLINQFVFRIFDYSSSAIAEMVVRQERDRLRERFQDLVVVSCSITVFLGSLLVVCNQPFVALWTKGGFGWPRVYDGLLAVLFFLAVLSRAHIGLIGQTKLFGLARYIYFVEGTFFVLLSWVAVPRFGVLGMVGASILTSVVFSTSYGVWRTSDQLQLPARQVFLGWMRQPVSFGARMILVSIVLLTALRSFSPLVQLVVGGVGVVLAGSYWFLRTGMPAGPRRSVAKHVPRPLLRWSGAVSAERD
jgi:O-antigen/teichoic acid export membrane protein